MVSSPKAADVLCFQTDHGDLRQCNHLTIDTARQCCFGLVSIRNHQDEIRVCAVWWWPLSYPLLRFLASWIALVRFCFIALSQLREQLKRSLLPQTSETTSATSVPGPSAQGPRRKSWRALPLQGPDMSNGFVWNSLPPSPIVYYSLSSFVLLYKHTYFWGSPHFKTNQYNVYDLVPTEQPVVNGALKQVFVGYSMGVS